MTDSLTAQGAVIAVAWLAGGLGAGMFLSRVILGWFRRRRRGKESGDAALIDALKPVAYLWPAVAGAYFAALSLPLKAGVQAGTGKVLGSFAVFGAVLASTRLAGAVVGIYVRRRDGLATSASIFVNLARLITFIIGFLVLLQTLGVSITPLLTALGVGGLAVALALQDTLSNLFAGIHVIASGKVKRGDYIALDTGEAGYVEDINWRNTAVRQLPNNMVIVPNQRLASSIVINYHQPEKILGLDIQLGVDYTSDLELVERVTVEVARSVMNEVPGAVKGFEPFVRFHTFGDSSIDFRVRLQAQEFRDSWIVTHEFMMRLQKRYRQEGITIPFPIRTLDWKEGSRPGEGSGGPEV